MAKKGAGKPLKKAARKAAKKSATTAGKKTAAKAKKSAKRASAAAKPKKTTLGLLASDKRKEQLRQILLRKRNEVVNGLEAQMGRKLTVDPGQRIDSAMDSADLSSRDMDQGVDYSLLEMKYEQYKDIADAFRKLQNNTYGLCEECGEEIDIKRLAVNPLARYCIECKTRREELEKIQKEETRFKE